MLKIVFTTGKHEADYCKGHEADLHKNTDECKKNPGHRDFIPVKDFTLNSLPVAYQDSVMFELIQTMASLTVQVKVSFTSMERPKFYGNTTVRYPFYGSRGMGLLRLGTGRVWRIDRFTEKDSKYKGNCACRKCLESSAPSTTWGKIRVMTACHVVFDESEAERTCCVLGYDDEKSSVVRLEKWELVEADIARDGCLIKYVTCDAELVDKLHTMWKRFDELWTSVNERYKRVEDVDKLTVIVSHPHGGAKQVSVGQWTNRHVRDGWPRYSKYTYTACTCPGSSGASVYKLGQDGLYTHPHSGTGQAGNYSGEW